MISKISSTGVPSRVFALQKGLGSTCRGIDEESSEVTSGFYVLLLNGGSAVTTTRHDTLAHLSHHVAKTMAGLAELNWAAFHSLEGMTITHWPRFIRTDMYEQFRIHQDALLFGTTLAIDASFTRLYTLAMEISLVWDELDRLKDGRVSAPGIDDAVSILRNLVLNPDFAPFLYPSNPKLWSFQGDLISEEK